MRSSCPHCETLSHMGTAGCRGCALLELARGPLYFASKQAGEFTPEYEAALLKLGENARAVHAEVYAVAQPLPMTRTKAR